MVKSLWAPAQDAWSETVERIQHMLDRLYHHSRGQGLVEYALIIALIAIVVIAILILLGPAIGSVFSQIQQNL